MSDVEQIYALFVEANPVADPATMPETYQEARPKLHSVSSSAGESDHVHERFVPLPPSSTWSANRRTALVAAAVAVLVVGAAAMFLRTSADDAAPPGTGPSTPITEAFVPVTPLGQATTFIDRLDAGDVDGAMALLADPLGNIWFPPLGQITDRDAAADYLDFYLAIGTSTQLSECTTQFSGPSTIVGCQANQQSEELERLGLALPIFQMQFHVWDDGIREIGIDTSDLAEVTKAFNVSRFFEFRASVLNPRGLVQESGDPVWSGENGELMHELITEFLANNP
jgi:hypothetical protein